jgi:hypothetical protein
MPCRLILIAVFEGEFESRVRPQEPSFKPSELSQQAFLPLSSWKQLSDEF